MSYPYLNDYLPPIPTLEIWLGYPEESLKLGPFVAIIDTGADGSMIPQEILDELNAPFADSARIRSHWGEWRLVQTFTVASVLARSGFLRLRSSATMKEMKSS